MRRLFMSMRRYQETPWLLLALAFSGKSERTGCDHLDHGQEGRLQAARGVTGEGTAGTYLPRVSVPTRQLSAEMMVVVVRHP